MTTLSFIAIDDQKLKLSYDESYISSFETFKSEHLECSLYGITYSLNIEYIPLAPTPITNLNKERIAEIYSTIEENNGNSITIYYKDNFQGQEVECTTVFANNVDQLEIHKNNHIDNDTPISYDLQWDANGALYYYLENESMILLK